MASHKKCPICKKKSVAEYQPFCSKRCSDIDLGKWLGGHYAIPVAEDDETVDVREEEL